MVAQNLACYFSKKLINNEYLLVISDEITLGTAFTVIVVVADVAVAVVIQLLLIIEQVIASPFANEVLVYVLFVAPLMLTPPFFHW